MPEAKRIIKNFNKLAKVLLEFEMLYHRGWLRQVPALCIILKKHIKMLLFIILRE